MVRGMRLKDSIMKRNKNDKKTTSAGKRKRKDITKKYVKATPSRNRILNYFSTKIEGNLDFKMTPVNKIVNELERRNMLSDKKIDDKEETVVQNIRKRFEDDKKKTFKTIGKDNTSIKKKIEGFQQLSNINKDGIMGWKMCEETTLTCPTVSNVKGASARCRDTLSDEKGGASSTNQKARFIVDSGDQSELRTTVVEENYGGPLDRKK